MIDLVCEDNNIRLSSMEENSVDIIITDPPYDFDNETKSLYLDEFKRISKGEVIIFCPPENQWLPSDQYLFWIKPISTKNTSKKYSRFVEIIHIYGSGFWDASRHWSNYTNTFEDRVECKMLHPHQKPISLMSRLIANHTNLDSVVFDPFMGSGTTGAACILLGRSFIGVEKDPRMFDVARKRILKNEDTEQKK